MKFLLTIITIWFCVDCGSGSTCSSNADCIINSIPEGFCAPSGGCWWCSDCDPASNYCAVCSSAGQNCDHNEQCFSGNCVGGNCSGAPTTAPSPTTAPTAVSSANSVFAKTFYLMVGCQVVWQFFR